MSLREFAIDDLLQNGGESFSQLIRTKSLKLTNSPNSPNADFEAENSQIDNFEAENSEIENFIDGLQTVEHFLLIVVV